MKLCKEHPLSEILHFTRVGCWLPVCGSSFAPHHNKNVAIITLSLLD